jgi:trimeric autotransporter adhesin
VGTTSWRVEVAPAAGFVVVLAAAAAALAVKSSTQSAAALQDPAGLALDTAGNLFIADRGNHRVRKLSTDGTMAVDVNGNLYITDRWLAMVG